jgi:large subunit ribosomal protein L13
MTSSFAAKPGELAASARWHVIDADGRVLGRIATAAARLLQGKHKPAYTPFMDGGDFVVIVNAAKVKLTGRKEDQKVYRQHSGYEGGLREERARLVRQRRPEKLVEDAVRGMLPKTKLGDAMYRKLKVYAGPDHPHAAQKPSAFALRASADKSASAVRASADKSAVAVRASADKSTGEVA